jgi:hypothetical protein
MLGSAPSMENSTRKLILVLTFLFLGLPVAAQQADPDVIWKGDFESGPSSLTGHCSAGDDQWCALQATRPQQVQVVEDPVAQGRYAVRFEVKYGDFFSYYSDSRSLITGPPALWENEGNERWYRWQALWPQDWVGSYPKWDELWNPAARSWAASLIVWHHDANGGVEAGSAPFYLGAGDNDIWLCLVNQATSECREKLSLAPLQRSHWHDFIMHAKWSSQPGIGFLEMWIDGVNVLPKHFAQNMYPGMRNYLIVGLYRNGHIGDPNLLYPNGTHVYGTNGTPGVAYLDGFIIGKTQQSVLNERPWGTPAPDAGSGATADGGPAQAGQDADGGTGPQVAAATVGYKLPGGGCASGGPQLAWLALPLVALAFIRRLRRLRGP